MHEVSCLRTQHGAPGEILTCNQESGTLPLGLTGAPQDAKSFDPVGPGTRRSKFVKKITGSVLQKYLTKGTFSDSLDELS